LGTKTVPAPRRWSVAGMRASIGRAGRVGICKNYKYGFLTAARPPRNSLGSNQRPGLSCGSERRDLRPPTWSRPCPG
jgi:hypothetical protein